MEILATKVIHKPSHNLDIDVYENFLLVEVTLPDDLYLRIVMELGHGSFDAERNTISMFTKEVFSIEYNERMFFNDWRDYYNELKKYGHEVEQSNNNKWFKTVFFPIDENNFENTLEHHLSYIKKTSENFYNNTDSRKAEIAKNLLDKL